MRPSIGRILLSLSMVSALLLLVFPIPSVRRQVRPERARTRLLADEKTKRVGMRHLGLAAAAAAALAVMGGSLALALGALGEEQPTPGRAPFAAARTAAVEPARPPTQLMWWPASRLHLSRA